MKINTMNIVKLTDTICMQCVQLINSILYNAKRNEVSTHIQLILLNILDMLLFTIDV